MNPYLGFGPGKEPVAWAALGAACLSLCVVYVARRRHWRVTESSARVWLVALAFGAASLSAGYVAHYLRGGPRIIDAAYYFLEARALSHGLLSFPVPDPLPSFHGRFLIATPDGGLGVLFPPGYPAALASAFLLGAPLAFGPLLGALLVPTTYWLARELGGSVPEAIGAAALGVLSAALRYHTADTMSHGFAALLVTATLAGACRGTTRSLLLAGLCAGWLFATRPFTGLVVALGAGVLLPRSGARALWFFPMLLPGLGLLLLHQHALTGQWFRSTQLAYYDAADGPPGCFRYGFGAGIGCWFEHGDFVRARLSSGYGLAQAAGNTLRRLGVHALDVANAAPLALLVPYGAWLGRKQGTVRACAAVVVGVLLVYAPFYFEGSYPGGGARFFADVLPLEHVLLAKALHALALLRFAWPLTLAGFALHTSQQHASLRDRDGGRPLYEPAVTQAAGVTRGLLFVTSDHGFALAHDPGHHDPRTGLVVARRRHDALDRLLWEKLGRPTTHAYTFHAEAGRLLPAVRVVDPSDWPNRRIEAESLWPPIEVPEGWAHPDFSAEACASRGSGLRLRGAETRVRLPHHARPARLIVGAVGQEPPSIGLLSNNSGENLLWHPDGPRCWRSDPVGLVPGGAAHDVWLRGTGLVDYIELSETPTEKGVDN